MSEHTLTRLSRNASIKDMISLSATSVSHAQKLRTKKLRFHSDRGMTLLEVMIAITILTIVMGTLFSLSIGIGDAAQVQETRIITTDDTRRAIQDIVRELRQASLGSLTGIPGATLTYRVATDVDGNGVAVNSSGGLELSTVRTIQRDTADLNGDGVTTSQILLRNGANNIVLANGVPNNEDANNNGVLDAGEDANRNGRLDRGIWFTRTGSAVTVTLQSQQRLRRGTLFVTTLSETVVPRNP
ncbi:MAG TPA: prepilin-type N-terminal cleavage/methylation domain-containing protein [Candidatus Hydrogenedentes bacterium]|nr:prepilin-type N-terminal cleavage/methylation domain-containing protein [Candidatus Hydrogenedentota bacterium]